MTSRSLLELGVRSPWITSILKKIVHDFKEFVKNQEVTKINQAVGEMANNFNLDIDESDIEEVPEGVPEKLTNEQLLEYEGPLAEEAGEKKTIREERKESPRKFTIMGFSRNFCRPQEAP